MTTADQVTDLLRRVSQGDKQAEQDLIPRIYRELRKIAQAHLRLERPDHTLQATELVHEVYLRLTAQNEIEWKSRAQFFAIAAKIMRRILISHARRRNAAKRGGQRLPLEEGLAISDEKCALVLELDATLQRLAALNARQAKIVEMRYFGGLTEEEIAEVLGISSRTVKRDWTAARAWLYGELSR